MAFAPEIIAGFFRCAAEYGYRHALRRTAWKIHNALLNIPKSIYRHGLLKRLDRSCGGPLVSFVLPVYNVEAFLEECLDSLLQQTMTQIEIITVDDGSTDHSLEILNRYAAGDSRVQVFTQKNRFAGAARNLGLSKASGEYVVFLDSDDFFSPDLAKEAYLTAKTNLADAVIFDAKLYDNRSKKVIEPSGHLALDCVPEKSPFSCRTCPDRLFQITPPCPWTKMFRREFILKSGLQFQLLRNSNDLFFIYSALSLAKRIAVLDLPLVYYRIGLTGNLQTTKKKDPLCFYPAYRALHDKLIEHGTMDLLRQSYVNMALSGCLYNLRSYTDPVLRQTICNAFRSEIFDALELTGHESSYYYDSADYADLMSILQDSPGCEESQR